MLDPSLPSSSEFCYLFLSLVRYAKKKASVDSREHNPSPPSLSPKYQIKPAILPLPFLALNASNREQVRFNIGIDF